MEFEFKFNCLRCHDNGIIRGTNDYCACAKGEELKKFHVALAEEKRKQREKEAQKRLTTK